MRAGILHLASLAALASAQVALADPPKVSDPADQQILEAFLGHVDGSARECTPERMAKFAAQPEDITWQGSRYIRMALVAYRLTEDTQYLDAFVARMDALCGCMTKGLDGFTGWYGLAYEIFRHPDHPDRKVDVMLAD